jgi:hypothetical protein
MTIARSIFHRIYPRITLFRRWMEDAFNRHWHHFPFGEEPLASRETYLQIAEAARQETYLDIDAFELQSGFALNKDWLDDLALHTQVVVKTSPLCYAHGRVLYSALSRYLREHPVVAATERVTILETGTARGFSALCMARACSDQH